MTFKLMTSQVKQRARPLVTRMCIIRAQRVKVVGHTEELQLITFCNNWENVEERALYTRCVRVL